MAMRSGPIPRFRPAAWRGLMLAAALVLPGCGGQTTKPQPPHAGFELKRTGDEIVAAGRYFHTGTKVILWTDPAGFDAYRVQRRFGPPDKADWADVKGDLSSPNRYGSRADLLPESERPTVRGGGWTLAQLRRIVDLFVIHYDAVGTSAKTFEVLQDRRGLSVHFMLDLDGTIYQTLDLKERAWHAGRVNSRSVGIEIAHVGAYPPGAVDTPIPDWYTPDATGRTKLTPPPASRVAREGRLLRPARDAPILGAVNGKRLRQYDFTDAQYRALIKLTAALHRVFPKITLRIPRGPEGQVTTHTLAPDRLAQFHGILGHYHVATYKIDPGPAFDWDRLIEGAKRLKENN